MKHLFFSAAVLFSTCIFAQSSEEDIPDSMRIGPDHFDLYGALDLFKQSGDLSQFEQKLNDAANYVNDLDLNNDGIVDYVRVEEHADGDVHAITIQDPVNENESQDVAVIEVEKTGIASADVQIVGDPELYGDNYVVEPSETDSVSGEGKFRMENKNMLFMNAWGWPCVRTIFAPDHELFVSPWHFNNLPADFHAHSPASTVVHAMRNQQLYHKPAYQFVRENRLVHARDLSLANRVTSNTVQEATRTMKNKVGDNISGRVTGRKENMSGQASGRIRKLGKAGKTNAKSKAAEKAGNVIKPGGVNPGIHR
ncbi:MAG: hypothetical protein HY064_08615 [Bacteroidetes bacterium]|nr:hypothetical protein [Bacteroidota bacterium]